MTATVPTRRGRLRSPRDVLVAMFVVAALGFVVFLGYWVATGGRWFIVETPSMGTSAPVGTLLWEKPVAIHQLHVGEFITFRPPGSNTTYSHRVYAIHPDGTISTKGQITPEDPWRLHASNLVGKVEMRWWAIGWLVKAAPLLILGGLIFGFAVSRFARPSWRLPLRVTGAAVLGCVSILLYRPLIGAVQLSFDRVSGGGRVSYVSTGLLPLQLRADGDQHVNLRAGQVGTVISRHTDSSGRYAISLHPHVPFWFWVALVVVCFLPAMWTTLASYVHRPPPRHGAAVA